MIDRLRSQIRPLIFENDPENTRVAELLAIILSLVVGSTLPNRRGFESVASLPLGVRSRIRIPSRAATGSA